MAAKKGLLVAGAAAAALLLMPKKKKSGSSSSSSGSGSEPKMTEDGLEIALTGDQDGYSWRVLKSKPQEGFATGYFSEMKPPYWLNWLRVHDDVRSTAREAELLAMEAIALDIEQQSGN